MRTGIVIRNIPRVDRETIHELRECGVATVHEAMGRLGLMKPYMRPIYAGARCAGAAITVLAQPGDNMMIHVAIEQCQPGDVLVVALTAENTDGMFGDLLASSVKARGVQCLVIDAGCRDVASLRAMEFPVWSRCISARGTVKATLGSVNVPVVCAGAAVNPGDVIVADDDGVVVVPRILAREVASKAKDRVTAEEIKRAQLSSGQLSLDLDNLRPKLAELGLRYFDTLEDVDRS